MSLYDGIKDAAKVVQKADNIELYQKLLDLSAQALDMQEEIAKLKAENTELNRKKDISEKIERHIDSYITLKNDALHLKYCTHCWDVDSKLVQVVCDIEDGTFECPHCKMQGIYDRDCNRQYNGEIVNQLPNY